MVNPLILTVAPTPRVGKYRRDKSFQSRNRSSGIGDVLPLHDLKFIAKLVDGLAGLQLLLVCRVEKRVPEIRGTEDGSCIFESAFQGFNVVEVPLDNLNTFVGPGFSFGGVSGNPTNLPAWFIEIDVRN